MGIKVPSNPNHFRIPTLVGLKFLLTLKPLIQGVIYGALHHWQEFRVHEEPSGCIPVHPLLVALGAEEFQHQLHLPQLKGLGHLPPFQPPHSLAVGRAGIGARMKQEGNDSSTPALPPLEKHIKWPLRVPKKWEKVLFPAETGVSYLVDGNVRGQHLWILLGHALVKNGGEKIQDFLFLRKDRCQAQFIPGS